MLAFASPYRPTAITTDLRRATDRATERRAVRAVEAGVTTRTATRADGRWQAVTPDGIAHLFFVATPGIGHAICSPEIRPVEERYAYPALARCLACLNHIEYGPGPRQVQS